MLVLTVDQNVSLSVQPHDASGNVAAVDGVPTWSVSDPTVLNITPAEDGLSAVVGTVGGIGSSQVNVTVDVKLGEEVKMLTGILDIEVRAGEAVSLDITAGEITSDT